MSLVLDSHALMVYLEKESSYEKVRDVLTKAAEMDDPCFMTYVNWGEIFYIVLREQGIQKATQTMELVETLPIEFVEVDRELAHQAALFKASKKMSYADCFSAALAKLKGGDLMTGDKEFKEVEKEIDIVWL